MKILAISGSLRSKSYNSAIVRALKEIDENVNIYKDLGKLPFFNPDINTHTLEEDFSPALVQEFRKSIASSDAIIISTPEYAFEISGVLKNALDWLVSSAEIVNKPVAIISASTSGMGGDKANIVLMNLVKVLTGKIEKNLTLTVSMVNKKINDKGKVIDKVLIDELHTLLYNLKQVTKNENYV
ncbi:NADPH-dependent FMN reductase [Sulfurimonas sp.]|uniref:NADPH-dependent FMN reductase n=1 Tax=Sulfurimonas sp. TaxID=2022749 RepID=UPI003D1338A6